MWAAGSGRLLLSCFLSSLEPSPGILLAEAAAQARKAALAGHDPAAALLAQLQASLSTGPAAAGEQPPQPQGQLEQQQRRTAEAEQAEEQPAGEQQHAGEEQGGEQQEAAAVPAKPWWRVW